MKNDSWDESWKALWDADSAHDEYEWERQHRHKNKKPEEYTVKEILITLFIIIAIAVSLYAGCQACANAEYQKINETIERANGRL